MAKAKTKKSTVKKVTTPEEKIEDLEKSVVKHVEDEKNTSNTTQKNEKTAVHEVEFLKTYIGNKGTFLKGKTYELDEELFKVFRMEVKEV